MDELSAFENPHAVDLTLISADRIEFEMIGH